MHTVKVINTNYTGKETKIYYLHTFSRSLLVKASLRTLPRRSTSKARVARIRLLAVGAGNVFTNAEKK